MPWAKRPQINPAKTSPLPPVARLGGAFSLIRARPSGSAITVSAPFSTTTAPSRRAAARAAANLSASATKSGNRRENSPPWGVITAGAWISAASRSAAPAKTVRASASNTVGSAAAKTVSTWSLKPASAPAPGPMRAASNRRAANNAAKLRAFSRR